VLSGLAALGLAATPSESNFILFSTGDHDAHEVWEGLVARSVLVRDLSGWPRLAGHLRVTIGTGAENDTFLAALADVIG
jgi:histidinol-phosphate aminotransferase